MKRRRVLFMISSLRGGGSERQTLLLLRALDRDRFVPHLYLTERAGELLSQVPADVRVEAFSDETRSSQLYFPGRAFYQNVRYVRRLLRANAIDLVYDRTFPMTLVADPATRPLQIPRVSTIVSPPDRAVPHVEKRFVGIKRARLRRAYRRSARVIAVSRQAAISAESYYRLPSGTVTVLPNPVDGEWLAAELRDAAPPPRGEEPTLVCVGRMTEEKGHADLLDALELLETAWPDSIPPITLWLVGDGPLRPILESRWHSRPHRHHVEFLGSRRSPAPWIAAADALILPSRFEGMPNVVLEAMSLGTPVIATRAGGTIELERETPTIGWSEPGRPDSLAAAIRRWATHREEARAMARSARAMIEQNHDVTKTVRTLETFFLEALAGRPSERLPLVPPTLSERPDQGDQPAS